MPELPEVETITKQLQREIKGKKIKEIKINLSKIVQASSISFFKKKVLKAKIKKVWRRAKMIIIELNNDYSLMIHLKLSGQLLYFPKKRKEYPKYTHLLFIFSDNSVLSFNDLRQFGYCRLVKTKEVSNIFKEKKIGPEPLSKDFTLEEFKQRLKKRPRSTIKPLLMDQSFVAGVGNIYAQEACWWAKVRPDRKVKTLKEKEIKDLYHYLIKILESAIKAKGTTAADDHYRDTKKKRGNYAFKLKVYQKQGEKCSRCKKGTIKRIKLSNRGTSYCSVCQK